MRKMTIVASAAALVLGLAPTASAQEIPPTPPRDEWYAANDPGFDYWSDGTYVRVDDHCLEIQDEEERVECSVQAFKERPFTVIAFVDTGINPYHHDFRAPDFVHHPSTYVEGYPQAAPGLNLSFEVADEQGYDAARAADLPVWNQVPFQQLRWIPGTRIIGGYGASSSSGSAPWILDNNGHGTGVASVAAGRFFGANPNALIVAVEGLGDAGLTWATNQQWIDIVSNSWGNLGNLPLGSTTSTRNATRRGQTVAFAAGNGATNTNSNNICVPATALCVVPPVDPCKCKTPDSNPSFTAPYGGPSWVLTVGAASPINGQAHWWHSIPVDVASFGSKWRAASRDGVKPQDNRDFGGTSCATPTTAGVLSAIIERARIQFNDPVAGQRPGQVIAELKPGGSAPESGPLADGKLTRLEAEAIVQKTAFPVPADPEKITWDYAVRPTTGTPYDHSIQGYGIVDRTSKALALKVLMGEEPMPDRSDVDASIAAWDTLRNAVWGNP